MSNTEPKTGLIAEAQGGRTRLSLWACSQARWNGVDGETIHYEVMTWRQGIKGTEIRHKYYRYGSAQECMEAFLDMAANAGHDITLVFRFKNGGTHWLRYGQERVPGTPGH